MAVEDRVIVALDVDHLVPAVHLVSALKEHFSTFKVGMELFHAEGPELFRVLDSVGARRIFYDGKLHDIDTTVAKTLRVIDQCGIWMTNIHATMGLPSLWAARKAVENTLLIGMTVLSNTPADVQYECETLADRSVKAHLDGMVVPASCIQHIRQTFGTYPIIVTPGIRLPGDAVDEHKQKMTPGQALAAGANYVVIGRTLTRHPLGSDEWHAAIQGINDDIRFSGGESC